MSTDVGLPTFLVTGVSETACATTVLSMACDLPNAVTMSHSFGPDGSSLIRTVSDITGILDRTVIDLEHACVPCAIREDILPTLSGLAQSGRWSTIIARLPLGADTTQICRVAAYAPEQLRSVSIAGVINALEGCHAQNYLLGTELMCDLPLHTFMGDDRGAAEVSTSLVEYSDIVAVDGELTPDCSTLIKALARPAARVVSNWTSFDSSQLLPTSHDHAAIEEWVCERPPHDITEMCVDGVWRIRLSSDRALHPQRMQENLPELGGGRYRTRGCFWVPTRPDALCLWDGAAGQLNIGTAGRWATAGSRRTDFVVTGLIADGDPRAELREAFNKALCAPDELDTLAALWQVDEDGLEPWLGDMKEYS